jgi:hypothetical protein
MRYSAIGFFIIPFSDVFCSILAVHIIPLWEHPSLPRVFNIPLSVCQLNELLMGFAIGGHVIAILLRKLI